jgi:hypothetical protein
MITQKIPTIVTLTLYTKGTLKVHEKGIKRAKSMSEKR